MKPADIWIDSFLTKLITLYATLSYPFLPLISGLAHEAFPFISWLHTASLYKNKSTRKQTMRIWIATILARGCSYTYRLIFGILSPLCVWLFSWHYTCERHHLEQKSHDKLFISASKVDTPPNIARQTFLCRDYTETPVATNQPQWHKKQLLQCI